MPLDQSVGVRSRLPARFGGIRFHPDCPSGSFSNAAQPTRTFGVATRRERRDSKRLEATHSRKLSTDRRTISCRARLGRTASIRPCEDTGRDPIQPGKADRTASKETAGTFVKDSRLYLPRQRTARSRRVDRSRRRSYGKKQQIRSHRLRHGTMPSWPAALLRFEKKRDQLQSASCVMIQATGNSSTMGPQTAIQGTTPTPALPRSGPPD